MTTRKATPIFFVEAIEPALPFWMALGWTQEAEVPHAGKLGFVILKCGNQELMLQTHASLAADLPQVAALTPKHALYCDVPSLEEARASVKDCQVLVEARTTFYGAHESWVVDPSGVVIGLAQLSVSNEPTKTGKT